MNLVKKLSLLSFLLFLLAGCSVGAENLKAKEDFEVIEEGMSSDQVVELLGEPAEITMSLPTIGEEFSRLQEIYKNYFEKIHSMYDMEYLNSIPYGNEDLIQYNEHRAQSLKVAIGAGFVEKEADMMMYTYDYQDVDAGGKEGIYIYHIVFLDDEVLYLQ